MRAIFSIGMVVLGTVYAAGVQAADDYPSRPIHLIVPFAPGGAVDTFARMLSPLLVQKLSQPVIIENKTGAGGTLGSATVAQAPSDGYTALLVYDTYAIAPLVYPKLPYDQGKLMPVALLAKFPLIMLTSIKAPGNFDDFISYAHQHVGDITFSSGGTGSSGHLTGELIKERFNVDIRHVPYRGGGPAMNAVVAQETDLTFLGALATSQFVRAGKVNALAVMGDKEVSSLSGVPTISKLGHPDLQVYSWYGLILPTGTPTSVTERLRNAFRDALADPEISRRINEQGGQVVMSKSTEFASFIQSETTRWGKLIKASGILLEQ